jgi:hypothetical protein
VSGISFEDFDHKLSATLQGISDSLPPGTVSLRYLLDAIGEQGLLLLCALLTLPFMIPVSIPGVSTVFGFGILSIGISVTINRVPWLPRQILDRPLATDRLKQAFGKSMGIVGRIERLVRPRWAWLTRTPAHRFVHGLALALAAGLLMLPFGLVPFSNTLPALAALLLALGLLERDGLFILGGHLMNVVTIVYFGTLVGGAVLAGRGLAGLLGGG